MEEIQGYCEFDMTTVKLINPQLIKGRNRSIITGNCEKCGNIAYKIVCGSLEEHEASEYTTQDVQREQQTGQAK